MANQKIFCNVPWTNTHIYWDGSFGLCCSERQKIYDNKDSHVFNLKNMTIPEWYNKPIMKETRVKILGDNKLPECNACYFEEERGFESRRIRENFKSGIFTRNRFDKSFLLSNWNERFVSSLDYQDQSNPIDWHIDLGNECNLACKMCNPSASSLIASKYKKWGISDVKPSNWTNDETAWNNFITSIDETPRLNRIHFMGGEPMINKRFYQIIDYLLEKNKTNLSISYVSNGTIYNEEIYSKLQKFKNCDIEISLESFSHQNSYIRHPSNTEDTVGNIKKLISKQTDTFKIVLRSVPQLLNISTYHEYIKFAWDNKISVQSIPLTRPKYLSIQVLPFDIRQSMKRNFINLKNEISDQTKDFMATMSTGRDTSRLHLQLIKECEGVLNMLDAPDTNNDVLEKQLSEWLSRWDKEFNLNAYDFYPEFTEFLHKINYEPGSN